MQVFLCTSDITGKSAVVSLGCGSLFLCFSNYLAELNAVCIKIGIFVASKWKSANEPKLCVVFMVKGGAIVQVYPSYLLP